MMTHEDIWRAIDRLAATFGYSPSGLAKQAGLDPTAFNKSKRVSPDGKPRWPSTESIAKILAVTNSSMADFISLVDGEAEAQNISRMPRHIPVIGFAQAGAEGYFDEDGYPAGEGWDEVRFPDSRENDGEKIYALEVNGDSMEPLYRAGDLMIVSPSANIRRGDRVVVKTKGGEVTVKELSRQTATRIDLKALNPAHEDRTLPVEELDWMARIVWVSQ